MAYNNQQIVVEDAQIAFRNFEGKEDQYNRAGNRNFAVLLPPEMAEQLRRDGWNVKQLKPREEGDVPQDYIQVNVGYKVAPPTIVMITSNNRTFLGEDEVALLDGADIRKVDLIFTPYNWTIPARGNQPEQHGIKAYLKKMFVTIEEDVLDLKYADVLYPSHREAVVE